MDLDTVDWSGYDFVDLGCSKGGSIDSCLKRFGAARGLGVDLDPAKVEQTRKAGYDAVVANAVDLNLDGDVSFISMLDFFEHLPDVDAVEQILVAAARSARDFIYIKHPSFEGEETAELTGLQQYWWDWHGHTCHVRVADYCSIFERLGLRQYMIRYLERIDDSTHPCVIPVGMAPDMGLEDAAAVTEKPFVKFKLPLWRRQDIFVALRAFEPAEWAAITKPTTRDLAMMSVAANGGPSAPNQPDGS